MTRIGRFKQFMLGTAAMPTPWLSQMSIQRILVQTALLLGITPKGPDGKPMVLNTTVKR